MLLGKLPDTKGKPTAFIIAAPVAIAGKSYRLLMEVRSDANMQRLYVHEVVLRDGASPLQSFKSGADSEKEQPSAPARGDIYNFMLNLRKIQLEKIVNPTSTEITPTGRDNTVKTAKGTKVGTKFMVIEADQLITSHDASGNANPLFPQELQPRDRSRETSQAWVQRVAASLDPDSLGRTGRADSGAPIIGSDRVVESGNGRSYHPERKIVHENILFSSGMGVDEKGQPLPALLPQDDQFEKFQPKDGQMPVLILLGGRGGSGKSKFSGLVYDPATTLVLDADAVKERMPEYEEWNANQVHEESSDILDKAISIALEMRCSLCIDATMKSMKSVTQNINNFRAAGYRIEAHYMHLPRQEAAKRAVGRFLNPSSGRYVPIDVILSNTDNEKNFDLIKPLVDAWSFRDNNVGHGEDPILISQSSHT